MERKLMETAILTEVLPIELTNGNDGRGGKWFKTAKVRKVLESKLRRWGLVREPFDHPVTIRLTRVLGRGQRLWDADSVGRGNSKELIDAMVACGWFTDDSPKYIAHCDFRQDPSQRENGPAVLFEVFHVATSTQEMSGQGQTEPVELSTDFTDADSVANQEDSRDRCPWTCTPNQGD